MKQILLIVSLLSLIFLVAYIDIPQTPLWNGPTLRGSWQWDEQAQAYWYLHAPQEDERPDTCNNCHTGADAYFAPLEVCPDAGWHCRLVVDGDTLRAVCQGAEL